MIEIGGTDVLLAKVIGRLWHDSEFVPHRLRVWVGEHMDRYDDRKPEDIVSYAQAARVLKAARNRALGERSCTATGRAAQ